MTVIRPNSVSGITSITAQANEINFFRSNGALAGLQLNGVNFNTTTGVSTFNNLDVGGVLTYQDVTNVDSIGIITARSTIDAQGDVSIADKIIHTGDTNTAIRFPSADTITAETAGSERLRITSNGKIGIGITNPILDLQIAGNYGIGKTNSNGSYGYFVPYNGATGNMEFNLNWPGGSTESIIFNITGNERMRISPQGYVTKPEHPYFNCTTTPTAGSPNIHSFGNVATNNGGHYNNSNGRFTAPVAGFYHFSCGIWCNASGSNTSKHLQMMRYINYF